MADVASIAWLRREGNDSVNRIGSSSIWSWGKTFRLRVLSMVIDQYQQNKLLEGFI